MTTSIKGMGIYGATRARPVHDGRLHSVKWELLVPSGTLIEDNCVIRLGRIDPSKCIITRALVDISGNLDGHATPGSRTLVGTLGYLKSADRSGTNISFKVSATTTAATEDDDYILAANSVGIVAPTGAVDKFGAAGDEGLLGNGGFMMFAGSGVEDAATGLPSVTQDSRGYDANVMDVAISVTEPSSTATTADVILSLTLEFLGVGRTPVAGPPYLYRDRYGGDATGSI